MDADGEVGERDLKRKATRPAAQTRRGQQQKFEHFRRRFNDERPHDALDGTLPSERWTPSARPYPEQICPPEYPGHLEVQRVTSAGTFRRKHYQPFISTALAQESIGLEEVGDGVWSIVYYTSLLGRLDERTHEITGEMHVL